MAACFRPKTPTNIYLNKIIIEKDSYFYMSVQTDIHTYKAIRGWSLLKKFDRCFPRRRPQSQYPCGFRAVFYFEVHIKISGQSPFPVQYQFFLGVNVMNDDTEPLTIKPYWSTMSAARLHSHLLEMRYPEPLIRKILKQLHEVKASRRAKRIKQTVVFNLWDDLLRPARTELGVVRTMKSQLKKGDDSLSGEAVAKYQALSTYEDVLADTIATLRAVQKKDKLTPNQFAEQVRQKSGLIIPNKGEHWTDYVDAVDRRRVTLMFNNLPDPKRGKKKVPFERHISPAENHEKRTALAVRLVAEQEATEVEYDMVQHPQEKERLKNLLDQMQYAQYALDTLPHNAPVPATWHGLLNR